jgi:glyoxylase-like metal-dependent hydrolase (beta-lactamase superfamily II)
VNDVLFATAMGRDAHAKKQPRKAPPREPIRENVTIRGMSESPRSFDAANPELIHITIPVGMLQCNCTIIADPISREALVVDPGDEVTRILELLGRHKLTVKAIVSTHAHIDHVGGLAKLRQYTGAPVLMHRDDLPLYHAMDVQAAFLRMPAPELTNVDQLLKEGDTLQWGGFQASVIHTPGHTPGSVCLYLPKNLVAKNHATQDSASAKGGNAADDATAVAIPNGTLSTPQLFAGDTLFAGSIGRTDLWGGSMEQILESLRAKLLELPDETKVFPGHGPTTSIGQERQTNPFLKRT